MLESINENHTYKNKSTSNITDYRFAPKSLKSIIYNELVLTNKHYSELVENLPDWSLHRLVNQIPNLSSSTGFRLLVDFNA